MKCTIVVIGELKVAFIDRFALANTISTIVIANAATDGLAGATDRCAAVAAVVTIRDHEVAATADRTIDREVTIDPDPTNATTTDPVPTSDTIRVLSIATTDTITTLTTVATAIAAVRRPKAIHVRTKKFTVAKETDRNRFHTLIRRTYRT